GIRVKEPVQQELVPVKLDEVLDHVLGVTVVLQDFVYLVDPKSFEKLHDENAGSRDFAINLWDDDEVTVPEQFCKSLEILGLMEKIHLFGDHTRKFVDDCAGGSNDVMIDELFENENQVLHNPYIRGDQFLNARAQHLYDDFFSMIPGPMDLSERCGSQR